MTAKTLDVSSLVKDRLKAEIGRMRSPIIVGAEEVSEVAPIYPYEEVGACPPPIPSKKKASIELKEGQVLASSLLGISLAVDFAVDVLKSENIPTEVVGFIPTVDERYAVQPDEATQVLRAIQYGDKMLVTGPTGSGKSSLLRHICALTKRPMVRLNMSGDVESANIFGQLTAKDGATVWKDGAATEAVRYGAVLVNDEWDVTPPEIMFGYQWLMEDDGKLYLKEMPGSSEEKLIHPHKEFRFVCLGNTLGQGDDSGKYAGTNVQNTATLDRFNTTIVLNYLSNEHERVVLKNSVPSLADGTITNMLKIASLIRDGYTSGQLSLSMSPRTLINWGKKMEQWQDNKVALALAYTNKLSEVEKGVAMAMYAKVFGK